MQLPGQAPYAIPDSAVIFEAQVDPTDPALAYFDCGTDATAISINTFFRTGQWVARSGMVALRFGLSGARVGYAAVVMNRQRHPDSNGTSRADYLVVWMMGVDKTFHGMADPGSASGATIADAVMKACDLVAQANGAVGVSLWVREANHRARRLYGRNAFREDPRGVFLDKRGVAMLEMRKLLAP